MPEPVFSDPALEKSWRLLLDILRDMGSVCLAFSGGVDSSLLLAAAKEALGDKARAVMCIGVFTPPWEADRARRVAKHLGIGLLEVDAHDLDDPLIKANDDQRCYYCKRRRLNLLQEMAGELGDCQVIEGSQADDAHEYRPGSRAMKELGVRSPLAEAGLNKARVRALSRALSLETAEIPSSACLATRVPCGRPLQEEDLQRIGRAETVLREMLPGRQLRVRDHFPLARLELDPEAMSQVVRNPLRGEIVEALGRIGYQSVCLDLRGYRAGGADLLPDPV